jgi:hypothetical protein
MERLRAALLGCLLAGGVLFGARPVTPRHRALRPVVYASGLGGDTPVRDLEPVWFQPLAPGTTAVTLRAQAGLPCAGRLPNLDAWCDWSPAASPAPVPRPRIRCIERVAGRLRPA